MRPRWITATCNCGDRLHRRDETALLHAQRRHLHRPYFDALQIIARRHATAHQRKAAT